MGYSDLKKKKIIFQGNLLEKIQIFIFLNSRKSHHTDSSINITKIETKYFQVDIRDLKVQETKTSKLESE